MKALKANGWVILGGTGWIKRLILAGERRHLTTTKPVAFGFTGEVGSLDHRHPQDQFVCSYIVLDVIHDFVS